MFDELNTVFKVILELATARRKCEKEFGLQSGSIAEYMEHEKSENGKKAKKSTKELRDFLNALDFEVVKIIQTIMYLGRDKEYNEIDTIEERYRKNRECFDKGWNTKSIEVNQMVEKGTLDKYLKDGFDILEIKLL